ncbi:MAG: MarR family winged helix-turn-helix transcriptional regulator [Bacteroidetes bacterium]|jgi:DNA-binding MarR family transcriptional regulator|nr:MarR family winged helix-turn-helix transcriptional regulator [Bacteroidota bacterium]
MEVAQLTFQLLVHCQVKEAAMAAEFDLAPSELRVLRMFGGEAVLRQRELHERLGMSGSRLTRIVDVLVVAGLVTREEDPDDRRGALLCMTPSGTALLSAVDRRSSEMHAEILASLPVERQRQVVEGLRDMLNSVVAWSATRRRGLTARTRTPEEQNA